MITHVIVFVYSLWVCLQMADTAVAPPAAAPAAVAEVGEEPPERPPHVPLPPLDLTMPPEEYWVSDLRWIQPGQLCVVRAPRNKDHLDSLVREGGTGAP